MDNSTVVVKGMTRAPTTNLWTAGMHVCTLLVHMALVSLHTTPITPYMLWKYQYVTSQANPATASRMEQQADVFVLANSDNGRTEHAVGRAGADDSDDVGATQEDNSTAPPAPTNNNGGVKAPPSAGGTTASAASVSKAGGVKAGGAGGVGGGGGKTRS
jgi:hypothetical protein